MSTYWLHQSTKSSTAGGSSLLVAKSADVPRANEKLELLTGLGRDRGCLPSRDDVSSSHAALLLSPICRRIGYHSGLLASLQRVRACGSNKNARSVHILGTGARILAASSKTLLELREHAC